MPQGGAVCLAYARRAVTRHRHASSMRGRYVRVGLRRQRDPHPDPPPFRGRERTTRASGAFIACSNVHVIANIAPRPLLHLHTLLHIAALFSPPSSFREPAGAGLRRAAFLGVLRGRPTFSATRDTCVPPRAVGRARFAGERTRARRMRGARRKRHALRRLVALGGTDTARHHHAQEGERRAREALVRAGAGFGDDGRAGKARAAGRHQPFLARRGWPRQLASGRSRAGAGRGRRASRAGRRRPDLRARLQADVRDRGARCRIYSSPTASSSAARPWCSPGRPRRRGCSTTPMTATARCGRATASSACCMPPWQTRAEAASTSSRTAWGPC